MLRGKKMAFNKVEVSDLVKEFKFMQYVKLFQFALFQ